MDYKWVIHIAVMLLILPAASAEIDDSIFDVLNETYFDGNWSVVDGATDDYSACKYSSTLYIISKLSSGRGKRGQPKHTIYVAEYRNCVFREYDKYGAIICGDDGCWISMMCRNFMLFDDVWSHRSTKEKAILNNTTRFKGVCPRGWHPSYGDPVESTVQNHKHLWGDPKIRFENASMINGSMYIEKDSNMIIDANVWHSVDEIDTYKSCKNCERWYPHFDDLNVTITTHESGEVVTANVAAMLKWYYHQQRCWLAYKKGKKTIVCEDYFQNTTETAIFTTTARRPNVINTSNINCTAYITFYNHSRSPTAFISAEPVESVIKTTFTYNNSSVVRYERVGQVMNATNCVEFSNNTTIWHIDEKQKVISRRGNVVVVRDRDFNLSELDITLHTPYTQQYIDDFRLTIVEPKKPHVNVLVKILIVLIVSVVAIIMMVGVVRRRF